MNEFEKAKRLKIRSVVSLFMLLAGVAVYSAFAGVGEVTQDAQSFTGIYEPSGLTYLGEGAFLLVEDEPEKPFHLVRINSEGGLDETGEIRPTGAQIKLNDLEGVTFDGQFIYAITSHSLTNKGKQGKGRSVLVRYRYEQGELIPAGVIKDLKNALITQLQLQYPQWGREQLKQQLNIEALAWSPENQRLYIGLRTPVVEGSSLLVRVDNPADIFEQQSAVGINVQIIELGLEGVGIRAMDWDALNRHLLIIAGDKKKLDGKFSIWAWRDHNDEQARQIRTLQKGIEGLATFEFSGLNGWLVLRDDGKRKKQKPAHYRFMLKNE